MRQSCLFVFFILLPAFVMAQFYFEIVWSSEDEEVLKVSAQSLTVELLEKFSSEIYDVNVKGKLGRTPLMIAARYSSDTKVISKLIADGAVLEERDENGWTALLHATTNFNSSIIEILILSGANIEVTDNYGITPLMSAACCNTNLEVTKILFEEGAQANALDDSGRTATMWAVELNNNAAIKHLLIDASQANPVVKPTENILLSIDNIDSLSKPVEIETSNIPVETIGVVGMSEVDHAIIISDNSKNPEEIRKDEESSIVESSKNKDFFDLLWESGNLYNLTTHDLFLAIDSVKTVLANSAAGLSVQELNEKFGQGVDLKIKGIDKTTPLMWISANNSDVSLVELLLDGGEDLEARSEDGRTVLMWATSNKSKDIINFLINSGARVEARDRYGKTVLMYAAQQNEDPAVIQSLISAGASLKVRDGSDWTPFMYAVGFNSNPEIIKLFIENGVDIEQREAITNKTPLILSAELNQNPEIIKVLMDAGADVIAQDRQGNSAWNLIQNNINLKNTDAYWRLNELRFLDQNNLDEIDRDISLDEKVVTLEKELTNDDLQTDLFMDIQLLSGFEKMKLSARKLTEKGLEDALKRGVDVNARGRHQFTALMLIAGYGELPVMVDSLVNLGAQIDATNYNGWSSLHYATRYNTNFQFMEFLIAEGANIDAQNVNGWTPLMIASKYAKDPEPIRLLLNAGADLYILNDLNKIAWDYIKENEWLIGTQIYEEMKLLIMADEKTQ